MTSRFSSYRCRNLLAAVALVALLGGCSDVDSSFPSWAVQPIENPTPGGAMSPSLHSSSEGTWLSWLAPTPGVESESNDSGPVWTVGTARLASGGFVEAGDVARSNAMFANWADFPSTATAPSGAQYVHHLSKLGSATFAYGVFLLGRTDDQSAWIDLGLLHDDASATEHGFVSYAWHDDDLRAFWLDGRLMLGGGPMTLRTTRLPSPAAEMSTGDEPRTGPPSQLLDDRVCECCQTDAATTADGPIVVYRNRTPDEIRDIYIVRAEGDGWSDPLNVHDDGWEIAGCPVNGPAVVADRDFVAVAWFTAADGQPRTRIATSLDGGRSFSRPLDLAGGRGGGRALGRIDLVIAAREVGAEGDPIHELWVAHFGEPARASEAGPALLVDHIRFEGRLRRGTQTVVAGTSEERSSGFPRMAVVDGSPVVAWVEGGEQRRVRTARLVPTPDSTLR